MKKKAVVLNSMLFFIFSICCDILSAQEKVNISVGVGVPEAINLGFRFQHKQAQLGISLGSFPLKDEKFVTVSADLYYHFGGISDLSERRPWFTRSGLIYILDKKATFTDKVLLLNLRIGRDFNISEKTGFEIDAGIGIRILSDVESGWDFPVIPALGIIFFYRL
jgi:hypothetical protein